MIYHETMLLRSLPFFRWQAITAVDGAVVLNHGREYDSGSDLQLILNDGRMCTATI